MADANIVAFDPASRGRAAGQQRKITERELTERQQQVPLEDCHVALERVTVQIKLKSSSFTLFHDLSAVFPKGRRIVVLGHKGSGKSTMFDLVLRLRPPNRGAVLGASRLSFPITRTDFIDTRLSFRDNLVFASNVLGVDRQRLTYAVQRFCGLNDKQLRTRTKDMPQTVRRRMGLVFALAADFDCHLVDGSLSMKQFAAEAGEAEAIEQAVFGRDYINAVTLTKQVPGNADLAYILYDGRLYYFDDIKLATDVFNALPIPEDPGAGNRKKDGDEDDEPVEDQLY